MVNAGAATDAVIEEFAPLLEPGDMIIDGGNAHFNGHPPPRGGAARERASTSSAWAFPAARRARSTARRSCRAARRSRGRRSGPMLEAIAAKVDGVPCATHVGPGRRRALREDGAQRHRVRRHAAHRRGVRPARGTRVGYDAGADRRDRSAPGTPGASTPTCIEITGRGAARAPTRRRARRSSTSCSTRPSRRAPAGGPCRSRLDLGVPVDGIAEATFAAVAVRPLRPARRRQGAGGPGHMRRSLIPARSPTRSSTRSTRRRSSPTPRAGT